MAAFPPHFHLSNHVPGVVAMEYFEDPKQREDAINCSNKFSAFWSSSLSTFQTKKNNCVTSLLSCSMHPQMELDLFCTQCGVEVCRECCNTNHRGHEHITLTDKIHEETQRLRKESDSVVEFLEQIKQAVLGAREMRKRVRNRKDNDIDMTREVFSALRKTIDEKEAHTIQHITEAAHEREKALEVRISYCISYTRKIWEGKVW